MNDDKLENEDQQEQSDQQNSSEAEDTEASNLSESENDPELSENEETSEDSRIEVLEAENKDLNSKILLLMADMENLRRRKDREIVDKEKYAITKFAKEILSIGDNIQRAIEAVPEEAIAEDEHLKSLLEGVQMTERELNNIFERQGIKKIDATGQAFDPNIHQAMFEVPSPDVAAGTVVQVMQAGYVIGERTLRPALVGVSKGGVKETKSEEPPELPKKKAEKAEEEAVKEPEAKETQTSNAEDTASEEEAKSTTEEKSSENVGQKVDKSA